MSIVRLTSLIAYAASHHHLHPYHACPSFPCDASSAEDKAMHCQDDPTLSHRSPCHILLGSQQGLDPAPLVPDRSLYNGKPSIMQIVVCYKLAMQSHTLCLSALPSSSSAAFLLSAFSFKYALYSLNSSSRSSLEICDVKHPSPQCNRTSIFAAFKAGTIFKLASD